MTKLGKKRDQTPKTEKPENGEKLGWLQKLALGGKIATALLVVLVLFWFGFICEVREGNCAVILRFGAVRENITEAGVYLKLPWPFETVVTYDGRLQYLESGDLETTTQDKRNIIIQSYVVWQVEDPVLYHNSVGVQGTVDSYIKETVKSATNGTMGAYKLKQLVSMESQEIKIEQIQQDIYARVRDVCSQNYGIKVTDVSILRLSLPDTNLRAVFDQMKADRQKEIDTILANAQLQASEITLAAAEESSQIIAQGITDAAEINAKTESEVAKIYAEAQSANIDLYKFIMGLDTYLNSVDETTILVVKANEYPFNVLTQYSQQMSVEGNETVISDLNYILSKLPEADRKALVDAVSALIAQNAAKNGVDMAG